MLGDQRYLVGGISGAFGTDFLLLVRNELKDGRDQSSNHFEFQVRLNVCDI